MADLIIMYVVCLAIIKTVVHDGTTMNVNDRLYPGTLCLLLITTHYSSGPQPRQRALSPPTHQSRIAAFNDSTPTSSSHPELHIYSPNYDSVDWDYYNGDFNDVTFMESGIIITIMNQNPRLTIMEMTVACVASVSVRFRSKERGKRVKDRAKNGVFIF